jgi:hypothetical protein
MVNSKTEKKATNGKTAIHQNDQVDHDDQVEQLDQVDNTQKPPKGSKASRAPRASKGAAPSKAPRASKPAKEAKDAKPAKPAKATKPAKPAKQDKPAKQAKVAKQDKPDKVSAPVVKAPKNLKVAKKTQKGGNAGDEHEEELGKRYFKCIMLNKEGVARCTGRYSGKKPKQAASKACTRLYEEYAEAHDGADLPEKIVFGMHECTRASKKKKKYFYTGRRIHLETPEEVVINKIDPKTQQNMVIKYYYNNDVRKLTDIENCQEYPLLANYDAKEDANEHEEQHAGAKVKVVRKSAGQKNPSKKVAPGTGKANKKAATKNAGAGKKEANKKTVVKKEDNIKVKKTVKSPRQPRAAKASKAVTKN